MGFFSSRFTSLFNKVKKPFEKLVKKHKYDFYKEMFDNDIAKSANPEKKALEWFKNNYVNNPKKYVKRRIPKPGTLIMFDYFDPITKDTLEYWDMNPLVLVLEPYVRKDDIIRVQGINIHLLPPNIRKLVLYQAWYLYKEAYTAQLFTDKEALQVNIEWAAIKNHLAKFSAGFAFRRYAANRQTNVIEFNQEDWTKAVWLPSKKYEGTSQAKLEKMYQEYVRKTRSITGGESFRNK